MQELVSICTAPNEAGRPVLGAHMPSSAQKKAAVATAKANQTNPGKIDGKDAHFLCIFFALHWLVGVLKYRCFTEGGMKNER